MPTGTHTLLAASIINYQSLSLAVALLAPQALPHCQGHQECSRGTSGAGATRGYQNRDSPGPQPYTALLSIYFSFPFATCTINVSGVRNPDFLSLSSPMI